MSLKKRLRNPLNVTLKILEHKDLIMNKSNYTEQKNGSIVLPSAKKIYSKPQVIQMSVVTSTLGLSGPNEDNGTQSGGPSIPGG